MAFGRTSTDPEVMKITKDIDDFMDEMRDPTGMYVMWEEGQVERLPNPSGLGSREWTYDELQLVARDDSELLIHRRYRNANTIGRIAVATDQVHFKITLHSGSIDPARVEHTEWKLNPVKGYRIRRWTGEWSADRPQILPVSIGTPRFRDESLLIRQALQEGRNPLHRRTKQPLHEWR